MIIAASSVILDGQGYTIHPADPGIPSSVAIWVSLTDNAGKPVTGVTIRNVSVEGEKFGIYAEGPDSTVVEWGRVRSGDPGAAAAAASPRSLTFSDMMISGCHEGIMLNGQTGVRLSDLNISGNQGSGITIDSGQAQIIRCLITKNKKSGVFLSGGSGTEISSSTISENQGSGIFLKKITGVKIFDNILDNNRNIEAESGNSGVVLATSRQTGENIVGGRVIGGNYWARGGISLPESAGLTDHESDGIIDQPYSPAAGLSDPLPLIKPGEITSPGILTVNQVAPPSPVQVETVAPVQTPASIMSGIHAVIISDTIPTEMSGGVSYPVSITLYNDGSDDWITQHQVGIMALDDAASYSPSWMAIPTSGPVGSGQSQIISFSIRSPVKAGSYILKYQAARKGAGVEVLFGRAYTKTVIVK